MKSILLLITLGLSWLAMGSGVKIVIPVQPAATLGLADGTNHLQVAAKTSDGQAWLLIKCFTAGTKTTLGVQLVRISDREILLGKTLTTGMRCTQDVMEKLSDDISSGNFTHIIIGFDDGSVNPRNLRR